MQVLEKLIPKEHSIFQGEDQAAHYKHKCTEVYWVNFILSISDVFFFKFINMYKPQSQRQL